MAMLQDLIRQIDDPVLRERIMQETDKLMKQKKFGLVFEEHQPECVPLYEVPVHIGAKVALKTGYVKDSYIALEIQGDSVLCEHTSTHEQKTFSLHELVVIAEFGEPIYPYLKQLNSVCNAPESGLWHTLIEAENYHALQLLEYLYAGKVDCIYIDPPYNTGARDWKYNNDYVDSSDQYRHSKWLSMMEKRLKLAKKLLNPEDSVLIVTIDEKEYHHLGCLLEELFPEASFDMISSVINPAGVSRNGQFSRTNEYIYIVYMGTCRPTPLILGEDWIGNIKNLSRKNGLRWNTLLRSGSHVLRKDSPNQFYPIFVSNDGKHIIEIGESYYGSDRTEILPPEGCIAIWPIRSNGEEGNWQVSRTALKELLKKGYVRLGRFNDRGTMAIDYLKKGEISKIENGIFTIKGYNESGSVIVDSSNYTPTFIPGCQWNISTHDATQKGTKLLKEILPDERFSYPKSLYATHDTIRFFVANKPNALIVDFFAGSGTTLHAVNLLNAEDGGNRRCILVTNNEVSEAEAKTLTKQGHQPGDEEWEKLGIARYVTWERTRCSIKGQDINGNPLKGNYLGSEIPMADGFQTNAVFFKLGFLDKTAVALGKQFRELLPVLWMKADCIGKCPVLDSEELPKMMILPENHMAILLEESCYLEFEQKLSAHPEIETIFFVTDSETAFRHMRTGFETKKTYQLYKDYLDNFRINTRR